MKIKIIIVLICLVSGVIFTFTFLNKKNIYAKESYLIYAFQVGAFEDYDNAYNYAKSLPSNIIIEDNNLYKIYVGIYKNIDIVNKMLVYFEDNNIHIYIKSINVSKYFYNNIDTYELFLLNSNNSLVFNNINQSILDLYLESN